MKSLQDNYNLIKEGKGSKELFLKQVRREFPQYISNVNTFNQVTANLKTRGIISETLSSDLTSKNTEPNWFNIFNKNINEAKATEKKVTKEVKDLEEKNFDYKDTANADNLIGAEILTGFYAEMKDPKNLEKTVEEVKAIVIKNLSKDALYYVKDGQFGIKGLGYTQQEQKEAKGKHKASGYGDITEGIAGKPAVTEAEGEVTPFYLIGDKEVSRAEVLTHMYSNPEKPVADNGWPKWMQSNAGPRGFLKWSTIKSDIKDIEKKHEEGNVVVPGSTNGGDPYIEIYVKSQDQPSTVTEALNRDVVKRV